MACSMPAGNGPVRGVPRTKCEGGTGISSSRPGRASEGAGILVFEEEKNMVFGWPRDADGYWRVPLKDCVTSTGAGEAWWRIMRQPCSVCRKTFVAMVTATPTSSSCFAVMFSAQ